MSEIKSARYGCLSKFVDVTDIVRHEQERNLPFTITNTQFGGDPFPKQTKFLIVEHKDGWKIRIAEGAVVNYALQFFGDYSLIPTIHPFVTFIIPSIGRPSVIRTLESLFDMQSNKWRAIVVFDGPVPPETDRLLKQWIEGKQTMGKSTDHITISSIVKTGFNNCAGDVRNVGIRKADTDWLAFVDDDDVVTSDYMLRLEMEMVKNQNADLILFRMLCRNRPMPKQRGVILHEVGISFAMKRFLCTRENFWFSPSEMEDFNLITQLLKAGKNIHVSDFITYIVRPPP